MVVIGLGLIFFCTFYVPPSIIIYKNIEFEEPIAFVFSFSVVPLFIYFMFKNIIFSLDYLPGLTNVIFEDSLGGSSKGKAIVAFLVSCPLPVAITFLYYTLAHLLNKRLVERERLKLTEKNESGLRIDAARTIKLTRVENSCADSRRLWWYTQARVSAGYPNRWPTDTKERRHENRDNYGLYPTNVELCLCGDRHS